MTLTLLLPRLYSRSGCRIPLVTRTGIIAGLDLRMLDGFIAGLPAGSSCWRTGLADSSSELMTTEALEVAVRVVLEQDGAANLESDMRARQSQADESDRLSRPGFGAAGRASTSWSASADYLVPSAGCRRAGSG